MPLFFDVLRLRTSSILIDNSDSAKYGYAVMKFVARILLLSILLTSVATAWDSDNCGQDLVFDSAGASQSHDSGSQSGSINDLCGHCGHLGSHLLGYIANIQTDFPRLHSVWHGRSAIATPKPFTNFLFRPPRDSFAA